MSAKQDRQGVRTASQLEQKYRIGESFAKAFGLVEEAKRTAEEAQKTATEGMTPDAIFNALTNNGQNQGLYRGEDGELYINASYIVAGILRSMNGSTRFNLDDGSFLCEDENGNYVKTESGHLEFGSRYDNNIRKVLTIQDAGYGAGLVFWNPEDNQPTKGYVGIDQFSGELYIDCAMINPGKRVIYTGNAVANSVIDVPFTKYYDVFAVKLGTADSTEDTVVLAYKNGNTINGVGGWAGTASLAKELFFLSATFEKNGRYDAKWTIVDARKQGIYNAGSITTGTALNVKEIIGVI